MVMYWWSLPEHRGQCPGLQNLQVNFLITLANCAMPLLRRLSCALALVVFTRAGETGGENEVLRNTAQSQLKRRGC